MLFIYFYFWAGFRKVCFLTRGAILCIIALPSYPQTSPPLRLFASIYRSCGSLERCLGIKTGASAIVEVLRGTYDSGSLARQNPTRQYHYTPQTAIRPFLPAGDGRNKRSRTPPTQHTHKWRSAFGRFSRQMPPCETHVFQPTFNLPL